MSFPTENTDYKDEALAFLTSQFSANKAPNLRALLGALMVEKQALEAAFWSLLTERSLSGATLYSSPATNPILDALGALVGAARDGLDDSDYLSIIYLQIAINRSEGRMPDWSNIAAVLLRTSGGPVQYFESGNASFFFYVGDLTLNPLLVASMLEQAVPNGVGQNVLGWSTWNDDLTLKCCDINNPTTTGQGVVGDIDNPSLGGLLAASTSM